VSPSPLFSIASQSHTFYKFGHELPFSCLSYSPSALQHRPPPKPRSRCSDLTTLVACTFLVSMRDWDCHSFCFFWVAYLFSLSYSFRDLDRNRCIICLSPLHFYTFHSFPFLSVLIFLPMLLPSVHLSDLSNIYISPIARNKYVKHKPLYYLI